MSALYLSIGIPGSGKSTFSKAWCLRHSVIYISSDALRATIGTDEGDQTVTPEVFSIMRTMARYFLQTGNSALIDATNFNVKNRADFVQIARAAGVPVWAFTFNVPYAVCQARNAARERKVPEFVLERMYKGLQWPDEKEVDFVIDATKEMP